MKRGDMGSSRRFIFLLLLLSIFSITGCGEKKDNLALAGEAYGKGQYEEAEGYFLAELNDSPQAGSTAYIGYGYTLLQMGDYEAAEMMFREAESRGVADKDFFQGDSEARDNIYNALLDIYMKTDRLEEAADIYEKLSSETDDRIKQIEYLRQAADLRVRVSAAEASGAEEQQQDDNREKLISVYTELIELSPDERDLYEARSNLYYEKSDFEAWEKDLRQVIRLGEYEPDGYFKLYTSYNKRGLTHEVLKLADELLIYVKAHSKYITVDDYRNIIGILFRAEEISENNRMVMGDDGSDEDMPVHEKDYYFTEAEGFIAEAKKLKLADNIVERYGITIAERQGKPEKAYKLLGVYLNHYPEDRAAKKEMEYLANRLKVAEE